jgi:hypothetical protein
MQNLFVLLSDDTGDAPSELGYDLETAGALDGGRKVWALAEHEALGFARLGRSGRWSAATGPGMGERREPSSSRHLSRNLPLNDSMYAFCVGLPA